MGTREVKLALARLLIVAQGAVLCGYERARRWTIGNTLPCAIREEPALCSLILTLPQVRFRVAASTTVGA